MKTLAKVTAAALFATFIGCQENAVEPIIAEKAKPAATFQALNFKENLQIRTPEGRMVEVAVAAEVTYKLRLIEQALAKEIPPTLRQMYDLVIFGKGQMTIIRSEGLAKPEIWSFTGNLTSVVEASARGIEVIFTIEGMKVAARYRVMFELKAGVLEYVESFVEFPN